MERNKEGDEFKTIINQDKQQSEEKIENPAEDNCEFLITIKIEDISDQDGDELIEENEEKSNSMDRLETQNQPLDHDDKVPIKYEMVQTVDEEVGNVSTLDQNPNPSEVLNFASILDQKNPNPSKKLCLKCNKTFDNTDGSLEKHRKCCQICQICGKSLSSKSNLIHHLKTHTSHEDKNHTCELCQKSFSNRTRLKRHYDTHTGERRFQCTVCCKKFMTKTHLKRHAETLHVNARDSGTRVSCSECGKVLSRPDQLKSHMLIHKKSAEKSYFSCLECGKKFEYKKSLLNHSKIHSESRAFVCLECGKPFCSESNLKRHQLTHERRGNKALLRCPECPKEYGSEISLKIHMKLHFGALSCSHCDKKFSRKADLQDHVLIHETGEDKPFRCSQCPKKFASKGNLREHKRIHTENGAFSCGTCGKIFVKKSNLKTHETIHRETVISASVSSTGETSNELLVTSMTEI